MATTIMSTRVASLPWRVEGPLGIGIRDGDDRRIGAIYPKALAHFAVACVNQMAPGSPELIAKALEAYEEHQERYQLAQGVESVLEGLREAVGCGQVSKELADLAAAELNVFVRQNRYGDMPAVWWSRHERSFYVQNLHSECYNSFSISATGGMADEEELSTLPADAVRLSLPTIEEESHES